MLCYFFIHFNAKSIFYVAFPYVSLYFSLYYHHFSPCTKHTYAIHIYVARRKKRRKIKYINIQNQKNREREDGYCWGTELRALNTKNFFFMGFLFFGSFKEYSFALWNTHFGSNFGWNKKILYPSSSLPHLL